MRAPILALISALLVYAPALRAEIAVRKAVFSDHQLFWPGLEGKGRPAMPAKPKPAKGAAVAPIKIAVLPVAVKDWSESIPCDSCHRLSANGMEFFLENWCKDRMQARFPDHPVELIAPSAPLVEKKLNLMPYLDSLALPWDKWLGDSGEAVVYRPRDRFTSSEARKRLDRLGGLLGASHLLWPSRVKVRLTPTASNMHTGGLAWSFDLVLWNVAAGRPEWAMHFEERSLLTDLDAPMEGRLDKALGAAWDGMPAELAALWASEPR
jgi:hypothetical protein